MADYDDLIGALSLEEKVRLLTGATTFTVAGNEAMGLRAMAFSDGPTGVRGLRFVGGQAATLFPNATLLSAAWDESAALEVGRIVAEEAERQHIHVVLGPTINLHRSPLGGRLFEAYSEDPLLTGRLAAAYVRGVQEGRIGACLKHLVANEAETLRNSVNNILDEKTLRELYLLPFEIAVRDAGPWTIMAAYNDVNGVPATEHDHVQNQIVKGEWAYDGLIMSDWFATKSAAPAANGGLDLVMPGPQGPWGQALVDAVRSGEVSEATVDDHLRRLLRLAERTGALGHDRIWAGDVALPESTVRAEQMTRLAVAGMTVLTNDGTLPLPNDTTIALIGRHAIETMNMGGGSAQVTPPYSTSVADGLASAGARISVVDGVPVRTHALVASPTVVSDPETGEPGVRISYEDDEGVIASEHGMVAKTLVGFDDDFPRPVKRVRITARAAVDGRVQVGVLGLGDWTLHAAGQTFSASLQTSGADPGEGILNPPTWTTEVDSVDLLEAVVELPPSFALVGLVAGPAPRDPDEAIADAVRAAAAADVAVVVVGFTEEQETESEDKKTLALPGRQDDLVRAVAAVAKKTVVVGNAATPFLMPWLDRVNAVLWAGMPGQEGGHAIGAALLGTREPTGRLVTSFPAADGASPAWQVVPTDGVLTYGEGTFVGYRGYADGHADAPLFWFGHGLGYGSWDYGAPSVSTPLGSPDAPRVRVEITNTGAAPSREVVQVYLDPAEDDEPVRLVGWASATVEPGASAILDVACDPLMWRRWDTGRNAWGRLAPGGELLVARGLGDIRGRVMLP